MSQRYADFSSDDDIGSSTKRKAFKRRSLGGPIYSREHFMNEILGYTDEELFQNLKRYNFDCGPISGSTRKVYQKKLADKMVEGPPPPPPKTKRRSMGPTIRSLPTKMPEPDPGDDFISGSSGSDSEPEVEPDFAQRPTEISQQPPNRVRPSDPNHKGSSSSGYKDPLIESLLPSIQIKRLEKEARSTPPPEEPLRHPVKIQPMHRERVNPKPKSHASKESSPKEDVSIWVQIIILLICLLVTVVFLKYIESTETLPKAPDIAVTPPVTPNLLQTDQPEIPDNHTDTSQPREDPAPGEATPPSPPPPDSSSQLKETQSQPIDPPPVVHPEETGQQVNSKGSSKKGKSKKKKVKSSSAGTDRADT